jgi:hypothetical protein
MRSVAHEWQNECAVPAGSTDSLACFDMMQVLGLMIHTLMCGLTM